MKENKPLVSVVMPVFNAEKFVGQAIESILNQTLTDFEFIIVNDASTDNSLQIVNSYKKKDNRIRVFNNKKNLHMSKSLNLGIDQTRADFIARMDQDDISVPERLEIQYEFLRSHPNIVIVGNDISLIDVNNAIIGNRTYPTTSDQLKKIMFRYSPFAHPTIMIKKDVYCKIGKYDGAKYPCEDIDFWFRLGRKYEFASIPIPLLKYRVNIVSSSHSNVLGTEIMGFKIKINAIKKYGYKPTVYDIVYNILQFATAWFMSTGSRIRFYNFLRSKKII